MTSARTPRPPDEFDLEVELAGGEIDPELSAMLRADATFDRARDEIAAAGTWWARNAPSLDALDAARAIGFRPERAPVSEGWLAAAARWRSLLAWAALPLALAASLPLALLIQRAPEYAARGAAHVDLQVIRGDRTIDLAEGLIGGDEIAIGMVPDTTVFVTVGTVQEDGVVSLLVTGQEAGPDAPFRPEHHVQLDDYPGREWLVVATSEAPPRDAGALEQSLRRLLPDPEAAATGRRDLEVVEITRGVGER